jgi:DNA-binding MarR family transcriptional regulator
MVDMAATDLGLLLAKAYQEFVRDLRTSLAGQGFDDLGRSDGFVFRALAQAPMTVSDLAARLEISKQGAGQIVEDMELRGYVQRRRDPDDGRARPVELAPRGRQALAAASTFHRKYESHLARRLGPGTVTTMRDALTAMAGGETETLDPRLRAMYL